MLWQEENSLRTEDITAIHEFGSCLFGRLTRSVCTGSRIAARRVDPPFGGIFAVSGKVCMCRLQYRSASFLGEFVEELPRWVGQWAVTAALTDREKGPYRRRRPMRAEVRIKRRRELD